MSYRFHSKAASDVLMLEPAGSKVLNVIGLPPAPRGLIAVDFMPAAILALETAIRREQLMQADQHVTDEDAGDEQADQNVSLRQRAWPLLDMMRRASTAGEVIVWED